MVSDLGLHCLRMSLKMPLVRPILNISGITFALFDVTSRSAAPDRGLHCLPKSQKSLWTDLFESQVCLIRLSLQSSCTLASSVDPDQKPRSAASDLDLHCFPMSYKCIFE